MICSHILEYHDDECLYIISRLFISVAWKCLSLKHSYVLDWSQWNICASWQMASLLSLTRVCQNKLFFLNNFVSKDINHLHRITQLSYN